MEELCIISWLVVDGASEDLRIIFMLLVGEKVFGEKPCTDLQQVTELQKFLQSQEHGYNQ